MSERKYAYSLRNFEVILTEKERSNLLYNASLDLIGTETEYVMVTRGPPDAIAEELVHNEVQHCREILRDSIAKVAGGMLADWVYKMAHGVSTNMDEIPLEALEYLREHQWDVDEQIRSIYTQICKQSKYYLPELPTMDATYSEAEDALLFLARLAKKA